MGVQGSLIALVVASVGCAPSPVPASIDSGCAPSGQPSWAEPLAPGTWVELPGTSLSTVDPVPTRPGNTGPLTKVIGWSSFVVDERSSRLYVVAAGGHSDYSGNEVDVLDLEAEAPRWAELMPATTEAQLDRCSSHNRDGSPASREIFYGLTLNARDDRLMLVGGIHFCGNGSALSTVDSFDLRRGAWTAAGTHAALPVPGYTMGVSREPATDDVYAFPSGTVLRWDRATNVWSERTNGHAFCGHDMMSAFDTKRGRALLAGGRLAQCPAARYSLGTDLVEPVTFTGERAERLKVSQAALVYVAQLDRFLMRRSEAGAEVVEIDPETNEARAFGTTGGAAIPETINGPYNKFLLVPRLGGAVYVPSYDGNVWFLKLWRSCERSGGGPADYVFTRVSSCSTAPGVVFVALGLWVIIGRRGRR